MIQLSGAGKRFGHKLLFENTDWLITARDRVGLVPQGRRVFPTLSVEDNLLVAEHSPERHGWSMGNGIKSMLAMIAALLLPAGLAVLRTTRRGISASDGRMAAKEKGPHTG